MWQFLRSNSFLFLSGYCGLLIVGQIIFPILFDDTVVQDDFRQSCFWLWSLWDSELFVGDFFKDLYLAHIVRTPILYMMYKTAPIFTDSLLVFSKSIALILAFFSSIFSYLYFYKLSKHKFLSLSFAATMSVTFLCTDHLVAGAHTRAFIWLGLLSYLYFKSSNKNLIAGIICFILLLLSPITFLLCLGMEFFHALFKYFAPLKKTLIKKFFTSIEFISLAINTLSVSFLYLILFKDLKTQGVGESFSVPEMKQLAEFNIGGRHPIFMHNAFDANWWINEHWGLGIGFLKISYLIPVAFSALLLYSVFLLLRNFSKATKDFAQVMTTNSLAMFLYSSLSLYFAAQITFPLIFMPSRYIAIPSILLSIIIIYLLFANLIIFLQAKLEVTFNNRIAAKVICSLLIILFPIVYWLYFKNYYFHRFVSIHPSIKQVIEKLPKDSLIAAHPMLPAINLISATCKRKVFIDYERSMAYTKQSLKEIRRRNKVALDLTYASNESEFKKLMKENQITHFLANEYFYEDKYLNNPYYIEPYNRYLKKLTQGKNKHFYLEEYLKKHNTKYAIIGY